MRELFKFAYSTCRLMHLFRLLLRLQLNLMPKINPIAIKLVAKLLFVRYTGHSIVARTLLILHMYLNACIDFYSIFFASFWSKNRFSVQISNGFGSNSSSSLYWFIYFSLYSLLVFSLSLSRSPDPKYYTFSIVAFLFNMCSSFLLLSDDGCLFELPQSM